MTSTENGTVKVPGGEAVIGFLQKGFRNGLGAFEAIENAAVEIPLTLFSALGASDETTGAARERHRRVLRGLCQSIDSVASEVADAARKQNALVKDAARKAGDGARKA